MTLDVSDEHAFQIYVSCIHIYLFILHGYVTNSQYDQLPVGLIAQLVEHCTGIAETYGFEHRSSLNFLQASNCLSNVNKYEGFSSIKQA